MAAVDPRQELAELEELDRLEQKARAAKPSIGERFSGAIENLKYLPGFALEQGKNALRGFEQTASTLVSNMPGPGGLSVMANKLLNANSGEPKKELFPINPNEGPEEKLMRKTSEGLGSGLIMPGGGLFPTLATGAMSGAGGEIGRRFGEKAGMPGLGEFLGSLTAGGLTGLATGPKQSIAKTHIREALDGVGPQGYADATENARLLNRSGATTATVAETFPQNSAIMDLAREARGGNSSNALKTWTERRDVDLQSLGNEAMRRVGPPVDANRIAESTATASNNTRKFLEGVRGEQFSNNLAVSPTVPPREVIALHKQLKAEALSHKDPVAGQALSELADSLIDTRAGQRPITDLQTLSFTLKRFKDNPASPNASTGKVISDVDKAKAVARAEELLGQKAPAFEKANKDFRDFSRNTIDPTMDGLMTSLGDRNPLTAGPVSATRLNKFITGTDPQVVEDTAHQLSRPGPTLGAPVDSTAIARAIMQEKMAARGSTNPGEAIRGEAGSPVEQRIAALITAGGKDSQYALEPLKAADILQGFNNPAGRQQIPEMNLWQGLIRPFRTADMALTGMTTHGIQKEAAELLAQPPSPESIKRLQEIAMFDPNVRRILTMRSGLISGAEQTEER